MLQNFQKVAMRAWLNGPLGRVPLSTTESTTIGRECCDIICRCPTVDTKHAIIEYDEHSECFVLRDLNTIFGTYVNGCQVRSAVVRLTAGDIIRVGASQAADHYEFDTGSTFASPCPHHAAEMLSLNEMKEREPLSSKTCLKTSYPHLASVSSTTAASNLSVSQQGNAYPGFQQTRPFRAARFPSNSMPHSGTMPKLNASGANGQTCKDGNDQSINLEEVLKKDRKICELNDEVRQLRKHEVENRHKDCRLRELTAQVDCLQNQLSQAVSNTSNRVEVEALQARIQDLENQMQLRTSEMAETNEQMFKLKTSSQKQLNDKVLEINSLREEQERFRKDKNIMSGLLTQVQKDISLKDTTICRLTSNIERKKNELSDKDVQIAAFQTTFCVVDSHKQLESDLQKMKSVLISVEEKLQKSESNLKASEERYASLSKAMDSAKAELRQEKQHQKDMQKQLDESNAKHGDANKSNDSLTQELRNLASTLSRLRRRLQRLVSLRHFASNTKVVTTTDDEDDLTDDQIISKMKEIIEDGNSLSVKISDTNKKLEDLETTLKSVRNCGGKLKEELQVSTGSLKQSPASMLMTLQQELNTVQVLVALPVLQEFREILVSLIQVQLTWQNEMVTTLESCGFNVRLSDVGLVKHVAELHAKSEESRREMEASKAKLEDVSRQFRRDLEDARDRGRREVEERSRDKIEKLAVESEMKIRTEKAVIEEKVKENYEEKVNNERIRIAQLEERLCCLQKENTEKSEELIFYKQQEKQLVMEVESYRRVEAELREEILCRNLAKNETRSSIENSLRKKSEREMLALREQNAHLSCTLASVQERLSKANNKIHRQQLEITSLRCNPCASVNTTSSNKTSGVEPVAHHASFEVSRVNEKLRAEIRKHLAEIKKLGLEVDQCKSMIAEKDGAIARLEAELQKAKEDAANIQSQSHSSDELSAVGAECRAEQHVATIAKQKEALIELRKRMRNLQKGTAAQSEKPADDSNPNSDLTEDSADRHNDPESKNNSWLDTISKEADDDKAMGIVPVSPPVAPTWLSADPVNGQTEKLQKRDIHEGQNKDLKENLELSEQAYSSLLAAVTERLPVAQTVKTIPSLADQTRSIEREEISAKRQMACEQITTELSALKNKVTEYESTIERYDQELMKLRTADVLLESKSWQIDGLTSDVRSLVDEVACLHESLTRVREELRKEKRANAAAKGKKIVVEKDRGRTMGTIVKHTCFHNDSVYKTKERAISPVKQKRKSYQRMMLEEERKKCERNMEKARNIERLLADSVMIDQYIDCSCSKTSI